MNKKFIPYIIAYIMLLAVAYWLLFSYPKAELHLMLNECHTGFGDVFFKYYTMLAEWPLYVIAAIPLLYWIYKKIQKEDSPAVLWRWTLLYACSEGIAALTIRLLKIFFHSPRPMPYFEELHIHLPLVEGVKMHHSNSFPSGHASTFFLFFTFAALMLADYYSRNKDTLKPILRNAWMQHCTMILLLAMAAIGCYSRIYLSQHFLSDITVGSMVGVIVACVMYGCFRKKV